jgi:hypothetical protein
MIKKYTCPCCGYMILDEHQLVHMKYVKFVFGKMMVCSLMIQTMRVGQKKYL